MGFRDKFKDANDTGADKSSGNHNGTAPEIIFVRSDTSSVNVLQPDDDDDHQSDRLPDTSRLSPVKEPGTLRRSLSIFHPSRSRSTSVSSQASHHSSSNKDAQPGGRRRRLSERLHLRHHHHHSSSDSVPPDLPAIVAPPPGPDPDPSTRDAVESQWEQRATLLAGQNELARSASVSPTRRRDWSPAGRHDMASLDQVARGGTGAATMTTTETIAAVMSPGSPGIRCRSRSPSATQPISSEAIDEDIQEAIRLHEEGDLQRSTQIFGRLADSNGANNPLSQVLYGLALRHGWGCAPDTEKAVTYLSAAASNAAAVEELALQAGMKKGGAAKGELILAIFELANCFRHGWGIPKDAVAAKQYYETAANLGDTDAMNEAAWCYLEGVGCKKDKFTAAQYYRLAENAGNKTLGNSWIWKEKYDPGENKGKKKRR